MQKQQTANLFPVICNVMHLQSILERNAPSTHLNQLLMGVKCVGRETIVFLENTRGMLQAKALLQKYIYLELALNINGKQICRTDHCQVI